MRLHLSMSGVCLAAGLVGLAGCASGAGLPAIAINVGGLGHASPPSPKTAAAAAPTPPALDGPKSKGLYLALIRDMKKSGKPWAALAHLDEFDRRYGRNDEAILLRGDCLTDIGDFTKGETAYRKLLQGQAAGKAYRGLGRIAAKQDRWSAASGFFEEAVHREPTSSDTINDLGYALLQAGNPSDAAFRLRQAHDLAPADPTITNNLILALSASGDRAGSQALLEALPTADRVTLAEQMAERKGAPATP